MGGSVQPATTKPERPLRRWQGYRLERDQSVVAQLQERFTRRGFTLTHNQCLQADCPRGAKRLDNPLGTAPGFELTVEGCRFVCVPGVPSEFDALVADAVIAPLEAGDVRSMRRGLRLFGLVEGEVDERLAPIHERWPVVRVGYRASVPEIHVSLRSAPEHEASLEEALRFSREVLGDCVFTEREASLPETVLELLRHRGATLSAAESCTGGHIGDVLTDVPGSSSVLRASVVAYHNQMKEELLGVSAETLQRHGAVSEQTVREMASGVRARSASTHAVSASGIAGPGGGTPEKTRGNRLVGSLRS